MNVSSHEEPDRHGVAMPALEHRLCSYIETALSQPLPPDVEERARLHILDTLAAIMSGSRLTPGQKAIEFVRHEGGRPEALIIGSDELTSATNAALANGMSAHADETDDSSAIAALHPGCIVLPAALAAGEAQDRSGRDLLRATALGYDLVVRFSIALGAFKFHNAGHCVPGFAGVFGAAAAASAMAGLKAPAVAQALSYAAQQASGLSSWRRDPDHIEKAFAFGGMPARNGVAAVAMVASGMTGVGDVFSGRPNFLGAFSVREDRDALAEELTRGLGSHFEIALTTIKKWCVGSPIQPALDAIEALMESSNLTATNVRRIRITLPTTALTIVDHTTMPDLNIRILVAALLVHGELTFEIIHDHRRLTAQPILELAKLIDVLPSEGLERLRPERQAIVEVETREGARLKHHTKIVRGTIGNPMGRDEVEKKAFGLLAPIQGDQKARQLIEQVRQLEAVDSLRSFRNLLGRHSA